MSIQNFSDMHREELMSLISALAVIPAPSHREERRAAFCLDWFKKNVSDNAFIDDAQNVICEIGDTATKPLVLIMAHTDIVFDESVALHIHEQDGKWYCPGIGDDTAHVAQILLCAKYAAQTMQNSEVAFVFAANACEEGEGNLKGCKALMARYGDRLKEVITFDGYLDVINDRAVGSRRFRIDIDVTGGHSFRDFGGDNAIAAMAELISALQAIELPKKHITTFNFGHISGGTTVNSIAQHADLLYEFRADHIDNIRYMQARFDEIVAAFSAKYRITVQSIGERPCANGVDEAAMRRLLDRAEAAFEGLPLPQRYPASTDANIPLSLGIPAVCLGFIKGGGAHTLEEYIELDSVQVGFEAALRLVESYG